MGLAAQTIFNRVVRHLNRQGKKSQHKIGYSDKCLYRGPNGLACAVGGILPDRLYCDKIEGAAVDGLFNPNNTRYNPPIVKYFGEKNKKLLFSLQSCHDSYEPFLWLVRLKEIGSQFQLVWPLVPVLYVKHNEYGYYVCDKEEVDAHYLHKDGKIRSSTQSGRGFTGYWKQRRHAIYAAKGAAENIIIKDKGKE